MRMKVWTTWASAVAIIFLSASAPASTVCRPLAVPSTVTLIATGSGGFYYGLAAGELGGGSGTDEALLQLFSTRIGDFDLSAGVNSDWETCSQCVILAQNVTNATIGKVFFQDRGVLSLTSPPGDVNFTVPLPISLTNLRLVEVSVDPSSKHTTPVPGGDCYEGVADLIYANGFD